MLQREVADRIVARPGTSEYGVLSVLIQWRADVTRVLALPPGAFRPPPAVNSAVRPSALSAPAVPRRRRSDVRADGPQHVHAAAQDLGNALAPFASSVGVAARDVLRDAGIDPMRRPETLEIVEMARLADVFATAKR